MNRIAAFITVISVTSIILYFLFSACENTSAAGFAKIGGCILLVLFILDASVLVMPDFAPRWVYWALEETLKYIFLFRLFKRHKLSAAVLFGWIDLAIVNNAFPVALNGFSSAYYGYLSYASGVGVLLMHTATAHIYNLINMRNIVFPLTISILLHIAFNYTASIEEYASRESMFAVYFFWSLFLFAICMYRLRPQRADSAENR